MNLRWFQTYDKHGVNSPVVLQCWDSEEEIWVSVPFTRMFEGDKQELDGEDSPDAFLI